PGRGAGDFRALPATARPGGGDLFGVGRRQRTRRRVPRRNRARGSLASGYDGGAERAALRYQPPLRWLAIAGPLAFLAAGLWGFASGTFMSVAEETAKPLIVVIELFLALSIAATLALLVVGPTRRPR